MYYLEGKCILLEGNVLSRREMYFTGEKYFIRENKWII